MDDWDDTDDFEPDYDDNRFVYGAYVREDDFDDEAPQWLQDKINRHWRKSIRRSMAIQAVKAASQ
jgi:hypothetical protein